MLRIRKEPFTRLSPGAWRGLLARGSTLSKSAPQHLEYMLSSKSLAIMSAMRCVHIRWRSHVRPDSSAITTAVQQGEAAVFVRPAHCLQASSAAHSAQNTCSSIRAAAADIRGAGRILPQQAQGFHCGLCGCTVLVRIAQLCKDWQAALRCSQCRTAYCKATQPKNSMGCAALTNHAQLARTQGAIPQWDHHAAFKAQNEHAHASGVTLTACKPSHWRADATARWTCPTGSGFKRCAHIVYEDTGWQLAPTKSAEAEQPPQSQQAVSAAHSAPEGQTQQAAACASRASKRGRNEARQAATANAAALARRHALQPRLSMLRLCESAAKRPHFHSCGHCSSKTTAGAAGRRASL